MSETTQATRPGAELAERITSLSDLVNDLQATGNEKVDQLRYHMTIAAAVANTEFVSEGLRGNPHAILACLMYGHEQGFGEMMSLSEVHIVKGKPGMSAQAMLGKIRAAGHKVSGEQIVKDGAFEGWKVTGERGDTGESMEFSFTLDMARRAGLNTKATYQQYPEAMTWARSVSQLARILFSDVFNGTTVYTADELESMEPEREVIEAPTRQPVQAQPVQGQPVEVALDEEGRADETLRGPVTDAIAEAHDKQRDVEAVAAALDVAADDVKEAAATLAGAEPKEAAPPDEPPTRDEILAMSVKELRPYIRALELGHVGRPKDQLQLDLLRHFGYPTIVAEAEPEPEPEPEPEAQAEPEPAGTDAITDEPVGFSLDDEQPETVDPEFEAERSALLARVSAGLAAVDELYPESKLNLPYVLARANMLWGPQGQKPGPQGRTLWASDGRVEPTPITELTHLTLFELQRIAEHIPFDDIEREIRAKEEAASGTD